MCFSRSKKPLSPNYGGSKKPGQVRTPNEFEKIYTTLRFWNDISQLKYNLPHEYENPIPAKIVESSGNFMAPDNNENIIVDYNSASYAATKKSRKTKEAWVVIDLNGVRFVNKIVVDWLSDTERAKKFELLGSEDGKGYFSIHNLGDPLPQQGSLSTSSILVNKKLRYIKFRSTEYVGQQRLLIRNIKIYSDPFDWANFLR